MFPSWQCERCGYEELVARPIKPTAKHGAPAAEPKATAPEKKVTAVSPSATGTSVAPQRAPATRAVPAMKDRKGRALPPDVIRMMTEMSRTEGSKQ